MYRAGIQSNDRQRGEGNEEYILFQILQILQNLNKDNVLSHQNVMEGFNILIAVLDGNTIAKAYCLDFLLFEPVCTLLADKESLINFGIRCTCERLQLIRRIDNYDIPFTYLGRFSVKVSSCDVCIRSYCILEVNIYASSYESRQRKSCNVRPVVIVMIRAFSVCAQVCHNIYIGVEIRDRTSGIEAKQFAASCFCCRIDQLGKIYKTKASSQIIYYLHFFISFHIFSLNSFHAPLNRSLQGHKM